MSRYKNNLFSKKGQVGQTVSWIIATVVIIVILIAFIYISVLVSKTKAIGLLGMQSDVAEKPELLIQKTSFSHQLAGDKDKELIDTILNEANK